MTGPTVGGFLVLAVLAIVGSQYGLAEPIMATLALVLVYLLLANAAALAPLVDRFTASLGARPTGGYRGPRPL